MEIVVSKIRELLSDPQVSYNDFWLRIAMSIVSAYLLVMHNEEIGIEEAVFMWGFYIGMAGSIIIALLLTGYVYGITVILDRYFDWKEDTWARLWRQSALGFVIPSALAYLLAALFFAVNGRDILQTTYVAEEYIIVVFMLLVVNLYYFGYNSFLLRERNVSQEKGEGSGTSREVVIADTPLYSIPLKIAVIRYLYILKGHVFVRTSEMDSLNESMQLSGNLKHYEDQLDDRQFFRINRRMIVSFDACRSYMPGKNKTLVLTLDPEPYPEGMKRPVEHQRLCIVSEDRAAAFRRWIDR